MFNIGSLCYPSMDNRHFFILHYFFVGTCDCVIRCGYSYVCVCIVGTYLCYYIVGTNCVSCFVGSVMCVCALWVQILHFDFKFILLRKQEEFDIFPFVYVEIGMILSKDLLIILNSPNF